MASDIAHNNGASIEETHEDCSKEERLESTAGPEKMEMSVTTGKQENSNRADTAAVAGAQTTSQGDINPYAYLERDEFTSEIFKIEINNLPWRFGVAQLRKKLFALNLHPKKIKVLNNGYFAFVNFKSEEDRQKALDVLEGHKWKGQTLKVKKAGPAADPLLKKRKHEAEDADDEPSTKEARLQSKPDESTLTLTERLNQAVSPWWKIPYEEQLQKKEEEVKTFIKRLGREIQKNSQDIQTSDWLKSQFKINQGFCCELCPIKPSPVLNDYRNKCEFTVGQSPEGIDKTVGFRLGSYKGGSVSVVEPEGCCLIPDRVTDSIKSLQNFLQTETEKPGFDPEKKSGNWKMVTLRTNRRMDSMVIVVLHPQKLSPEEIKQEKEKLQGYFTSGAGRDCPIHSLYFSVQSDRHEQDEVVTYEHLKGEKYIEEDLLQMKFRISPGAFFQVNTLAAEILYSTVGDWCKISPNTVLLDICCGTGTIGLTMAKRVKKVIGIEMSKEAVDDANANMKLNDVTNAEFQCGKAEELLPPVIYRHCYNEDVVAVVDPPRAGLHADVIRAIRKCPSISRLVYVSCKPNGALNNLADLTRSESRRVRGNPFHLVKCVPIDLFPHTPHSELVMLFERKGKQSPNTSATDKQEVVKETAACIKQEEGEMSGNIVDGSNTTTPTEDTVNTIV